MIPKFQKTVLICLCFLTLACSSSSNIDNEDQNLFEKPADCSTGEISETKNSTYAGIINGKTVDYGHWLENSTVLLYAETIKGKSACTATIVSNDVLLTAAHCVLKTEKGMAINDQINFAIFSANPYCQKEILKGRVISMKDVIVHPEYRSDVVGVNDLALVRLSSAVPAGFVPMKVIDDDQAKELKESTTTFVGAGYGNTQGYHIQDTYAPRLRATTMSLYSIKGEEMKFDQRETGLCAGDSGGPIYAQISQSPVLAGVNSAVAPYDKSDDCRGTGYAMSIDYHRQFLKESFEEISPYDQNPF